ncbi:MAG: carboxypeptidase regulatory-like domain-containing protein, partial [Holophagales bacterium]|nr:carboxypeptidase regulatory-like domain-containing protein [Holophagales bacterium]
MTDWRLPRIGATSLALALLLCADAATAQQTGRIEGTVTLRGAASPDGIGILAETDAVPRPRSTVTEASGYYALPRLHPGLYRVTFTTPAGASRTVEAQVLLGQTTTLDLELDAAAAFSERLVVIGERVAVRGRAAVASAIDGEAVRDMPLGPDYRSLVRLAPGVQVTQDSVRGPAAGGSGQDNV